MQVYTANETADQNVWFDDLKVTFTPQLIVQENHYYPFELEIAGIQKQGTPNHRYTYMGVEKEKSFGLNWMETEWRGYDAQIGRFHGVDKMAGDLTGVDPYQYSLNNPIMMNDPSGLLPKGWKETSTGYETSDQNEITKVLDYFKSSDASNETTNRGTASSTRLSNKPDDLRFRDRDGNLIGTIKTNLVDTDVTIPFLPGLLGNFISNIASPVVVTAPTASIAGMTGVVDATGFGVVLSAAALGGAHIGLEFVFFNQGPDKGKYGIYSYVGGNVGLDLGVSVYGFTANYEGDRSEMTRDSWLGLFYSWSGSYRGISGNIFWGQTLNREWITPFYPGMNGDVTWRGSTFDIWSKSILVSAKFSVSDYKYAKDFFRDPNNREALSSALREATKKK